MSEKNNSGPAFPTSFNKDYPHEITGGLSKREYAAIKLRVPDSGTEWLDAMISASLRDEIAAKALQGYIASREPEIDLIEAASSIATGCYKLADAMLTAREAL